MTVTPEEKAFGAAVKERLRERARLLLSNQAAVIAELQAAKTRIIEILAGQPSDWQRWQLPQLLGQINAVLQGATGSAAVATDAALRQAWQQGEDLVDKPFAAAGLNIELQLPLLDVQVLTQLRSFTALRLADVATEVSAKIGRQLSLVTIGAQSPFEAIQAVQKLLGTPTTQRASTIVRTEVSRAFALASEQRMVQAAAITPLKKMWRRSGKIMSRWNHDAVDGQLVDVGKPFVLPSLGGTIKMMHPHDPRAPAEEVINCGCIAIPRPTGWAALKPGAKPFTERELALNPRKALLDQAAQRAGLRQTGKPGDDVKPPDER